MPIILEEITQPSPEDHNDLVKIYQDYPKTLGKDLHSDLDNWIENRLNSGQIIFGGRFNGRLLAAIWSTKEPLELKLELLCVRKLTRRRGVARQLLTLLKKRAKKDQLNLTIRQPATSIELSSLLQELNFDCEKQDQESNYWTFNITQ
jgi:ribosomal protein S18 acetylase RimI-like enzyme